jgi:hypothetical protein
MSHPLLMLAILVVLTHALRGLARRAGPRWGGLVLGLPCTTVLALASTGAERGLGAALGMAESGLLGLAASVALPVAYMRAIGRGWGTLTAAMAGVAGYAVITVFCGACGLLGLGFGSLLPLAILAVLLAWHLATPVREGPYSWARKGRKARASPWRVVALRTLVPVACFGAVLVVRDLLGTRWAGFLAPFPGLTLTMLVVTHLETGPAEACRMARTLPPSNLCMVAFFGACRLLGPSLGLGLSIAFGYAAALFTLFVVERVTRVTTSSGLEDLLGRWLAEATYHRWSRMRMTPSRFVPRFEALS